MGGSVQLCKSWAAEKLRACRPCRSGQLQTDCTPKADGSGAECYVAGQAAAQPCDAQQYGDPVKLPILMVSGPYRLNSSCVHHANRTTPELELSTAIRATPEQGFNMQPCVFTGSPGCSDAAQPHELATVHG